MLKKAPEFIERVFLSLAYNFTIFFENWQAFHINLTT